LRKIHGLIGYTIRPYLEEQLADKIREWMVDHSAKVIAIYNGTAGGTKKTIDYAEHRGVKVDIHET
jgi:hypothetical protein